MPVVSPCESSCIAQPPARFKSCAEEDKKQPIKQQVPVLAPPPRYPKTSSTPRSHGDCKSNWVHASPASTSPAGFQDCREASSSRASAALTTSARASSPRPQLSVMELVNQAARQAEIEAAAAAAAKRAGHRQLGQGTPGSDMQAMPRSQLPSSRYSSSSSSGSSGSQTGQISPLAALGNRLATPRQSVDAAVSAAAANRIPRAPAVQQERSGHSLVPSPRAAQCAAGNDSSRVKVVHAAAVQSHALPPSAFHQHSKLSVLVPVMTCSQGSDCGSDETLTLASVSSLSSSSSSSSLCSAASCGSNASTLSAASRPKSILLTRSSSSSTSSSASSPRFSKRVTWKDGQADEEVVGQELVAVRVLEDSPEMRQIRKDTWPERPGPRRDADEEPAAAPAKDQQRHLAQQQQQQPGPGLMSKLLEPSRLHDWREKLCLLQLERRQQRMEQVQAGWKKQQARQAHIDSQQQQPQCVDQRAPSNRAADAVKPVGGVAGPICITAMATAPAQSAAC